MAEVSLSLDSGHWTQRHFDLLFVLIHKPVLLSAAENPEAVPHGGVRHEIDHGAYGVVAEFPEKGGRAHVHQLETQHLVESGQEDPDDGAQVDDSDDGDHDELSDGLLEAGHAALPRDASAECRDRNCERHNEDLQNSHGDNLIDLAGRARV